MKTFHIQSGQSQRELKPGEELGIPSDSSSCNAVVPGGGPGLRAEAQGSVQTQRAAMAQWWRRSLPRGCARPEPTSWPPWAGCAICPPGPSASTAAAAACPGASWARGRSAWLGHRPPTRAPRRARSSRSARQRWSARWSRLGAPCRTSWGTGGKRRRRACRTRHSDARGTPTSLQETAISKQTGLPPHLPVPMAAPSPQTCTAARWPAGHASCTHLLGPGHPGRRTPTAPSSACQPALSFPT